MSGISNNDGGIGDFNYFFFEIAHCDYVTAPYCPWVLSWFWSTHCQHLFPNYKILYPPDIPLVKHNPAEIAASNVWEGYCKPLPVGCEVERF